MSESHTKKTTDFWGNEKEEHFDSSGQKIGETKFTTDWLGNPKQEHYDTDHSKVGETKAGTDFWGQTRAEHHDRNGKMIGYSRDETDFWGTPVQRHYSASHEQVGSTHRETGFFGDTKKVHEGQYFKARPEDKGSSESTSRGAYEDGYDSPSGSQVGISRQEEDLSDGPKVHKDTGEDLASVLLWAVIALFVLILISSIRF